MKFSGVKSVSIETVLSGKERSPVCTMILLEAIGDTRK
jgi:hypothetical protein